MISRISGKYVEQYDRTMVIETTSGLSYGILVSAPVVDSAELGQNLTLVIYEHIREQEHTLYGFLARSDQMLFEKLLSVNGVGPKAALSIFDLAPADEIRSQIASSNMSYLQSATGVGKKASERIVLELSRKLPELSSSGEQSSPNSDALNALLSLGYNQNSATKMLAKATGSTTEEIVSSALKNGEF